MSGRARWALSHHRLLPCIANSIWSNCLNKRSVESSCWLLPKVDHYVHREEPEELAGIRRACREEGITAQEDANAFMGALAQTRTVTSSVYMGCSTSKTSSSQGPSCIRRRDTVFWALWHAPPPRDGDEPDSRISSSPLAPA